MPLPPCEKGLDSPAQFVNTSELHGFHVVSVSGKPVLKVIDSVVHQPDCEPGFVDSRSPEQDRGILEDATDGFDRVFEQCGFFALALIL